jgi:hypothetical protein
VPLRNALEATNLATNIRTPPIPSIHHHTGIQECWDHILSSNSSWCKAMHISTVNVSCAADPAAITGSRWGLSHHNTPWLSHACRGPLRLHTQWDRHCLSPWAHSCPSKTRIAAVLLWRETATSAWAIISTWGAHPRTRRHCGRGTKGWRPAFRACPVTQTSQPCAAQHWSR